MKITSEDRLFLDVAWFLLLCAIFAFLRFHAWRKDKKIVITPTSAAASQTKEKEATRKAA